MPDMLVRLYDLPDPAPVLRRLASEGVTIRPARAYERHVVEAWVRAHFSEGWASECGVGFARQPVSTLVATEGGRVVGFACYDCTCRGFFGPTGVQETARGRGIGRALLLATLSAMAHVGYAYAVIGGVGPRAFYERACGATEIPASSPGIYTDILRAPAADA